MSGCGTARLSLVLRRLYGLLLDPTNLFCAGLIFAFLTRLYGAELAHTSDEGYWMQRSIRFGAALARTELESTYRSGHPGVTVMWTALAGLGPEWLAAHQSQRFAQISTLQRDPGYLAAFAATRHAIIVTASLLLSVTILLVWQLAGRGAGLVGGAMLLLDPYVVGMTRLLHPDALLAPLMAISGLAGLLWWQRGQQRYLTLSALAGGLALLTKAPAGYLPVFFGAAGVVSGWGWRQPRRWLTALVAWALLAITTYVLLWPALWVDAPGALTRVVAFIIKEGGQPHNWSSFFLGERITADPGPLFYPTALAFRLGPIALCGVLLALLGGWQRRREAAVVFGIGGFALGFIALMTASDKKFDRYLLPAIVMLDLLSGIGLWMLFGRLRRAQIGRALVVGMVGLQAVTLWSAYPYPLGYYNPLFGGTVTATQTIIVGWGEGLDQVAAHLNGQPDAERRTAATLYHLALRPLFHGRTVRIVTPVSPDYLVVYVNMEQRHLVPPGLQRLIDGRQPEFTAYVHGVPYAQVYHLPAGIPLVATGAATEPWPGEVEGDAEDQ